MRDVDDVRLCRNKMKSEIFSLCVDLDIEVEHGFPPWGELATIATFVESDAKVL
jgi:hypothetical protein